MDDIIVTLSIRCWTAPDAFEERRPPNVVRVTFDINRSFVCEFEFCDGAIGPTPNKRLSVDC